MKRTLLLLAAVLAGGAARAESPGSLLESYRAGAAAHAAAYAGPSARLGDAFFHARGKDWSCASCHTADPRQPGRHTVTGKPIKPLAPAANPARFTDGAKAEKWFKRNCNDTLGRECTAAEKADLLAYLISLGKRSTT
jgi:hypothetical protein